MDEWKKKNRRSAFSLQRSVVSLSLTLFSVSCSLTKALVESSFLSIIPFPFTQLSSYFLCKVVSSLSFDLWENYLTEYCKIASYWSSVYKHTWIHVFSFRYIQFSFTASFSHMKTLHFSVLTTSFHTRFAVMQRSNISLSICLTIIYL